jgi:hypothetical protein
MAVKKSTGATKKSGPAAKATVKKSAAKKETAPEKTSPKAAAATKATPKKATPKKAATAKAAPVKLTDRQHALLRDVHAKQDEGYAANTKALTKSLEQLKDKKLVKKGAKNKATGHVHYHISKAGEKHLGSTPAPAAPAPAASSQPSTPTP